LIKKSTTVIISVVVGLIADIILRINTGEEGNLLVHSIMVFGTSIICFGLIKLFMFLRK